MTRYSDWDEDLKKLSPDYIRRFEESLSESDREFRQLLFCAFPEGLKYCEWKQLIYLMYVVDGEKYPMSFRAVAGNIGLLLNLEYIELYNEVIGVYQVQPEQGILDWLRERLTGCGYYELLDSERPHQISAATLQELTSQLIIERPSKRVTIELQPISLVAFGNEQDALNQAVRSVLDLPSDWNGILWREIDVHTAWKELNPVLQYGLDGTRQYMSDKQVFAWMVRLIRKVRDTDPIRIFTNLRQDGSWNLVTPAQRQYWLLQITDSEVHIFGIEEDE